MTKLVYDSVGKNVEMGLGKKGFIDISINKKVVASFPLEYVFDFAKDSLVHLPNKTGGRRWLGGLKRRKREVLIGNAVTHHLFYHKLL